jgi:hypothetical protein
MEAVKHVQFFLHCADAAKYNELNYFEYASGERKQTHENTLWCTETRVRRLADVRFLCYIAFTYGSTIHR